jgi:hypothetical protein
MSEQVSPCCGADFKEAEGTYCCNARLSETGLCYACHDHSAIDGNWCDECDENFEDPEDKNERDARMQENAMEEKADATRKYGE